MSISNIIDAKCKISVLKETVSDQILKAEVDPFGIVCNVVDPRVLNDSLSAKFLFYFLFNVLIILLIYLF